jgi:hypothetical protein
MRTIVDRLYDLDITLMSLLPALQVSDELQQLSHQSPPTIDASQL